MANDMLGIFLFFSMIIWLVKTLNKGCYLFDDTWEIEDYTRQAFFMFFVFDIALFLSSTILFGIHCSR